MIGLGQLGLQEFEKARLQLSRVLELDINHQGARIHLELIALLVGSQGLI